MFPLTGYTESEWFSPIKQLPTLVESFSIVPRAGNVYANIYKLVPPNLYLIGAANLAINFGEMYQSDRQVVLLATEQIKIQVSGGVDIDFTMNNTKP